METAFYKCYVSKLVLIYEIIMISCLTLSLDFLSAEFSGSIAIEPVRKIFFDISKISKK